MTAMINHGSLVGNNKRRRTSQAELARQRLPVPAVSECSAEFPRNFVFKALSAARVADALTNFWRNLRGNFPCKSLNVVLNVRRREITLAHSCSLHFQWNCWRNEISSRLINCLKWRQGRTLWKNLSFDCEKENKANALKEFEPFITRHLPSLIIESFWGSHFAIQNAFLLNRCNSTFSFPQVNKINEASVRASHKPEANVVLTAAGYRPKTHKKSFTEKLCQRWFSFRFQSTSERNCVSLLFTWLCCINSIRVIYKTFEYLASTRSLCDENEMRGWRKISVDSALELHKKKV